VATEVSAQPTLLDGETTPAADLRRELLGGVYPNAGIVKGLRASSTPTPSMAVKLPAGLCLVNDGGGGFVPLYLTTDTTLDIAASNPTLARIDSVIAEVVDTGVSGTLIRRFRVITGTPASSPVAPALPAADQPTALTLRLANVFVQAGAETKGNVRSQDVTVQAVSATLLPRPVQTLQATPLDNPSGSGWTDFTTGQWPRITFTVPASGMAFVTVGAEVDNENTSTSTCRVGFRMSGGFTLAADFGHEMGGHIFTTASRRFLVTGMPAGASVTITPAYRLSTVGDTRLIHNGNLILEMVP
jgi:hypothetical protein